MRKKAEGYNLDEFIKELETYSKAKKRKVKTKKPILKFSSTFIWALRREYDLTIQQINRQETKVDSDIFLKYCMVNDKFLNAWKDYKSVT